MVKVQGRRHHRTDGALMRVVVHVGKTHGLPLTINKIFVPLYLPIISVKIRICMYEHDLPENRDACLGPHFENQAVPTRERSWGTRTIHVLDDGDVTSVDSR